MSKPYLIWSIFLTLLVTVTFSSCQQGFQQPDLESRVVEILNVEGYQFKDLNQNGELDAYEDWRLSAEERAEDLASRMTIEQIAGLMLYSSHQAIPSAGGRFGGATYDGQPYAESGADPWELSDDQQNFIVNDNLRHVLITSVESPEVAARWNNALQELCEGIGLGIPANTSSDPRHGANADTEYNAGAGGEISHWPENIGLAATFDPEIVRQFGEIASREYRALGITTALSPQIDLSTDPRWSRVDGTFSGDPDLATDMARAYVDGFQTSPSVREISNGWGFESVNAMVKHWPGGGAEEGGRDGHFDWGKYTVYPGDAFNLHLLPFINGAFNLNGPTEMASAVMPYYTISYNQDPFGNNVGNSYSNYMINTLLRGIYEYEGVVCTDWGITPDRGPTGGWDGGRSWGMNDFEAGDDVAEVIPPDQKGNESAGRVIERHYRIIMAGVDQFGGNNEAWPIIASYELGVKRIGEGPIRKRFEQSAVRLLKNIFRVGLFENPYLEPEETMEIVGAPEYMEAGYEAQQKSVVLLKNGENNDIMPLSETTRVYIPESYQAAVTGFFGGTSEALYYNPVSDELANQYFERVSTPEEADVALVFVNGPVPGDGQDPENPLSQYYPISLQYGEYTARGTHTVTGRSYAGRTITAENVGELEVILNTVNEMNGKPVIVSMTLSNPAIVDEFEAQIAGLVVNFGVSNQAILDVISGNVEPSGLLPFQMPANMLTVEQQQEDVPRDMEPHVDEAGNSYDFAFGLNWDGQIQDERYAEYYEE